MKPNTRSKLSASLLAFLAMTAPAFTAHADDTTYVSDPVTGRTQSVTGPGWSIAYTYDAAGNVTQITRTAPMSLLAVVSRKVHGTAGTYDLPLDRSVSVSGNVTIEPRVIDGGHTIVFQFNSAISNAGTVSVVGSDLMPISGAAASVVGIGAEAIVTLTGIPNSKRVRLTLTGVNGGSGTYSASAGFLVGDVDNTRAVNIVDISAIRARTGQPTGVTNFTSDLDTTGAINIVDVSLARNNSGIALNP